jgi:glycosyltransferase involved in cell wall biosynthesis
MALTSCGEVVINGRFLARPFGGVPRVGVELLRAVSMELRGGDAGLNLRVATPTEVDLPAVAAKGAGRRSFGFAGRLGEQLGMPLLYPGSTILSFCNATPMLAYHSVVWIHDAHVFDAPESYPVAYRLWHRAMLGVAKLRGFDVVTVSKFARERLMKRGVHGDNIRVIYNGGDHILREREDLRILDKVGLGDKRKRFVLLVGSPARHKNMPFALEALLASPEDFQIAIVGLAQSGPYVGARALIDDPRVVLLPRVRDGELRALYHRASAVVAPSLCEGFGLYAAEAMFANSGPLVLSNRGALPEVGGDAALYFDPTDAASLQRAVSEALRPRTAARLHAAARVQREKFRWRRAAREVIDNYLAVYGGRRVLAESTTPPPPASLPWTAPRAFSAARGRSA